MCKLFTYWLNYWWNKLLCFSLWHSSTFHLKAILSIVKSKVYWIGWELTLIKIWLMYLVAKTLQLFVQQYKLPLQKCFGRNGSNDSHKFSKITELKRGEYQALQLKLHWHIEFSQPIFAVQCNCNLNKKCQC